MDEPILMCGDCLKLMQLIPDQSVDLVICDLPYGTTACKWDSPLPLDGLWAHYQRVCIKAVVLSANQPFSSHLVMSNIEHLKYAWVWVKNRPTCAHQSKNRPMGKHEDLLVFSQAPMGHASLLGDRRMTYNPQGMTDGKIKVVTEKGFFPKTETPRPNQVGKSYTSKTGLPNTILNFSKEETHYHPTQKPVALMEHMIRTYTNEGDTVLDNCMGSGTTGVACMNTGRKFIGIEMDEKYFAIAEKRIQEAIRL